MFDFGGSAFFTLNDIDIYLTVWPIGEATFFHIFYARTSYLLLLGRI